MPSGAPRSATNTRPAGPYVGFELHLGVQTRDVRGTDGVERTYPRLTRQPGRLAENQLAH
jgi:hypothetical protein